MARSIFAIRSPRKDLPQVQRMFAHPQNVGAVAASAARYGFDAAKEWLSADFVGGDWRGERKGFK